MVTSTIDLGSTDQSINTISGLFATSSLFVTKNWSKNWQDHLLELALLTCSTASYSTIYKPVFKSKLLVHYHGHLVMPVQVLAVSLKQLTIICVRDLSGCLQCPFRLLGHGVIGMKCLHQHYEKNCKTLTMRSQIPRSDIQKIWKWLTMAACSKHGELRGNALKMSTVLYLRLYCR